jgi:glycosyltransferase involved in cell wall biosynthesis
MATKVLLVLPCYRPPIGWVERIIEQVEELRSRFEGIELAVTVVDDGNVPPLPTGELATLTQSVANLALLRMEINRGKGAALRSGLVHDIDADYFVYTDIDFPYELSSMVRIIEALQSGVDIAAGARSVVYYEHVPWFRKVLSQLFRSILRHGVRLPVSDTQCGLKGFNQKGRAVFLATQTNRYLFDFEFLYLATRRKLHIVPVEAVLRLGVTFRRMDFKILVREGLNFLRILLR